MVLLPPDIISAIVAICSRKHFILLFVTCVNNLAGNSTRQGVVVRQALLSVDALEQLTIPENYFNFILLALNK